MPFVSVPTAGLGYLVNAADANQIKDNLDTIRLSVGTPTGSAPNGNVRIKNYAALVTTTGAGNWTADGTHWLNLIPMLGRTHTSFVVIMQGTLSQVISGSANSLVDLYDSTTGGSVPATTHVSGVTLRQPSGTSSTTPVRMMRVFSWSTGDPTRAVYPIIRNVATSAAITLTFSGQIFYYEI